MSDVQHEVFKKQDSQAILTWQNKQIFTKKKGLSPFLSNNKIKYIILLLYCIYSSLHQLDLKPDKKFVFLHFLDK